MTRYERFAPLMWSQEMHWVTYWSKARSVRHVDNVSAVLDLDFHRSRSFARKRILEIVERNETFRTTFGGPLDPRQYVHTSSDLPQKIEVSTEDQFEHVVEKWKTSDFDIETGPLARFILSRTSDDAISRIAVVAHHLIMDGISLSLFFREFVGPATQSPVIQPADIALMQASSKGIARNEKALRRWRTSLEQIPNTPFVEVSDAALYEADSISFGIASSSVGRSSLALAGEHGVPVSAVFLGAFTSALARFSGLTTIPVVMIQSNRQPETSGTIGCLASGSLLAVNTNEDARFKSSGNSVLRALRTGPCSFADMKTLTTRVSLSRGVHFRSHTNFNFHGVNGDADGDEWKEDFTRHGRSYSTTECTLSVYPESTGTLVSLKANEAIFGREKLAQVVREIVASIESGNTQVRKPKPHLAPLIQGCLVDLERSRSLIRGMLPVDTVVLDVRTIDGIPSLTCTLGLRRSIGRAEVEKTLTDATVANPWFVRPNQLVFKDARQMADSDSGLPGSCYAAENLRKAITGTAASVQPDMDESYLGQGLSYLDIPAVVLGMRRSGYRSFSDDNLCSPASLGQVASHLVQD